jgi:hypothetical protein
MWSRGRREELVSLIDLLWKVRGLNNGSNFLDKAREVLEVANKLTDVDFTECKDSFLDFLKKEAMKND